MHAQHSAGFLWATVLRPRSFSDVPTQDRRVSISKPIPCLAPLLQVDYTVEMLAQEEDSGNGEVQGLDNVVATTLGRSQTVNKHLSAHVQLSTSSPSVTPILSGYSNW
jgi:hypothetical protein